MQKEIERKKHPSQVAQYIDSFLLFPLQCIFTLYLIYSSAENILRFLFEGADCGDFFLLLISQNVHSYLSLHWPQWCKRYIIFSISEAALDEMGLGYIIGNWMAPWVRMKAMQDYTHICFFNSQFFFRAGKSNLYYTVMH